MMQQVFSRINQVAIRADVVRLKMQGRLPQFTWLDVAGTWTKSCTRWPTDKLAIPADGDDPTMYQTPIGQLCWGRSLRKYAGLFALEHMRGVYEHGTVRVNRGDIVVDLGAQTGSFSRYALTQGAELAVALTRALPHRIFGALLCEGTLRRKPANC